MPRRRRPPRPGALIELPPLKILSQILILQAIWYGVASALILFTALVAGRHFTIDLVLSWKSLRGDTTVGWMLGLVWMLNSFIGVIALLFFISRSKLVPDFALTLHFIHLLVVTLYSRSIPSNWLWWALQIASAGLMTSLGVWTCQWRELRPINFGGSNTVAGGASEGAGTGNGNGESSQAANVGGDEDQGYGRRGRGRGRDGAGEYEMVALKSDTEPS